MNSIGVEIHKLAKELWPINRSITGDGVRSTLKIIKKHLKNLKVYEVKSGTKVFDWTVPKEWKVKEAWIKKPNGEKICDFNSNNLHLVGYSEPVHKKLSLSKLSEFLHSRPDLPEAIPFVTSYYKKCWGFCISEKQREKLPKKGKYEVFIDSKLFNGSLTYGELIIPGRSKKEILISTYICHPSMANNELSGPTVTTYLAKSIIKMKNRNFTYRIIFVPETIGSISYLSKNIKKMKNNTIAGFNINCVGDNRAYSLIPSKNGSTLTDKIAKHILKHIDKKYVKYTWKDRGSDERQYCAPHIDLPVVSIMRTKHGEYKEYHTSLDDLKSVVTPNGLEGGYNVHFLSIQAIEKNFFPSATILGEPHLSKRNLYPTLSKKVLDPKFRILLNFISYSDGTKSLLEIAELCEVPIWTLYPIIETLTDYKLIKLKNKYRK